MVLVLVFHIKRDILSQFLNNFLLYPQEKEIINFNMYCHEYHESLYSPTGFTDL